VHSRTISEGSLSVECDWPCLGVSFKYKVSVSEYLWERVPATVAVAAGGAICFLALGLVTGIVAARRRGTLADKAIVSSSLIINAVPFYLLALLSFLYLVQRFHLFPPTGYFSPFTDGPLKFVSGMLLPWLMLGIGYATQYARFSRGSMIEALNEDYVRTARAKGISERRVLFRHSLRTSMITFVSLFGLDFAALVAGGALLTEVVFGIHGVGYLTWQGLENLDLPTIMATTIYGAFFIVLVNAVVDIAYAWLDPRIRPT